LVTYIHDVPGRLRVRSMAIKRNPQEAERVRAAVAFLEGVSVAEANVRTGSLTVAYETGATSSHHILGVLNAMGYAVPSAAGLHGDAWAKAGEKLAQAAMRALVDKLVERSAVAVIGMLI
jgi:copper chaperone CopZ